MLKNIESYRKKWRPLLKWGSSWGGSLVLHGVVLLIAFFCLSLSDRGGGASGERRAEAVGIVFSTDSGYEEPQPDLAEPSFSEAQAESQDDSQAAATTLTQFLPQQNRIGVGAASTELSEGEPLPALPSSNNSLSGPVGTASGQTVGFGGTKGTGQRFVYVLDRSDSMKWNRERPIRYAVKETQKSIASLDAKSGAKKFQLVYYNHDAEVFGQGRLLDVNESNKRNVLAFLDSLLPAGGTDPVAAIETAVRLRPDVIFFLTDADEEISPAARLKIHDLCARNGVSQIHVIAFGRDEHQQELSYLRLAEENHGMYLFRNINQL